MPIRTYIVGGAALLGVVLSGCYDQDDPDGRLWEIGYRTGTVDDDYLTNGERGTVSITEIGWAGSVEGTRDDHTHHPDDIFIELRSSYTRPINLTGWMLYIEAEEVQIEGLDERFRTHTPHINTVFMIPEREGGQPIEANDYFTIARNRDGAFPNADFYIEDFVLPDGRFEITLRDIDNRLISGAGDTNEDTFSGGYDLMVTRSMERVQLLFSNQGGRNASWHSYAYNPWDPEHALYNVNIAENYRELTFATPGMPNSPDYSGNTSSGSFE